MKALIGAVLAAALLVGPVFPLRCYTCGRQSVNATCDTVTRCPSGVNSLCMTRMFEPQGGPATVSKSCEAECEEIPDTPFLGRREFSCCSSDLCNEGTSASISPLALLLALGASSLLGRPGL